jgi:hypothetical protein
MTLVYSFRSALVLLQANSEAVQSNRELREALLAMQAQMAAMQVSECTTQVLLRTSAANERHDVWHCQLE